ncbi:MAG TPA: polysaccharide biosynthesis/export family protein [Flavobacteriaceae bacterium]|nr:polysaccharide biosynthesis/export family protein [Flavobacteriaceae bacterium]
MKLKIILLAITTIYTFSSCSPSKKIIYFQDQKVKPGSLITQAKFKYKPNDILTIDVFAIDEDVVKPFNLAPVSYSQSSISAQSNLTKQTYYVTGEGTIDFPVIGTLKIAGLTRDEAITMLKEKIAPYVKDPIITIRVVNFTVTVLGEVNSPGTFLIEDEYITLTQALGLAGDLTIYGKRENVFLIREDENNNKTYTSVDLTQINSVTSPLYYLQQNDVLYVEPNKAKMRSANYNQNNNVLISAVATLATIIAILIK